MTKYELYLCDIAGDHKPIVKFESETPFHSVAIGDRFDDHGWNRLDGVGKISSKEKPMKYTIHSIKHTVVSNEQTLMVQLWLNLKPYSGSSSPAWES